MHVGIMCTLTSKQYPWEQHMVCETELLKGAYNCPTLNKQLYESTYLVNKTS